MAKVNIIGAGLAGLSAGIYLQQSGVDTEIFELAGWAGGMCTAWVRQGYRFDGCIHWMVGTRPGDGFHSLYREVGALAEDTVIYNAPSVHIESGGVLYEVPLRFAEFKRFLNNLSPEDDAGIEEFCGDIERMMNTQLPAGMPSSLLDMVRMVKESRGFMALARKYVGMTVEEYCQRFKSPVIRSLLYSLMPGEISMEALFMMLGTRMSGNAGYPMGGALGVIERMQARYTALGGRIRFHSRVDEIIVEKDRAAAIRVGEEVHRCDAVIAACDAYDTLRNMLGGRYAHPQLDALLESASLFPPLAIVSFGLDRKMGIPFSIEYECSEGIQAAPGVPVKRLDLRSFDFDPGAAPGEGSSVMALFEAPLAYWGDLRAADPAAYRQQKQRLADEVAEALDRRIPGFRSHIRVTDVATPATYVHLTNVYKASYEGFLPVPSALKVNVRKTLPGVKRLLICGQWATVGGGICAAIGSGKEAAHMLKKEMGVR